MKSRKLTLTGILLLLLALSACNYPGESSELSLNDQAATIVAMTLDAAETATPTGTPRAANTPTGRPTNTPTSTPTGTITPTYSVPMLKINENTNCRTGPGQSYDILFTFLPGTTAEIAGKAPTDNYWVVKLPDGGTCWIWGEYSTASGSHWAVPTVAPPATFTPSPPSAPSISSWDYFCSYGVSGPNATINLEWTDRADNETGYRIYRNDERVADLPANSESYSEVIDVTAGDTITYRIDVYNSAGASSSSSISFNCQ